ncbi:MAG: transcription antitermination factor NusB [Prevotella sp.]|nr:transcription antitermination factor NusB [Prevotella sp.]
MINREIIRTKIVQLTYAYYQNGNKNIDSAEKELFFSLSKAYDLYNYLLALIVAVTKEARRRNEVLTARAQREGTEAPSQKFTLNRFALQLEENKELNEFVGTLKHTWSDDQEFVAKLYELIEGSETYQAYMVSLDDNYDADRELWRKIYRTLIQNNPDLDAVLEEVSLYWNDDKEIVDTFVLKTIKRFDEQNGTKQELLPEWDSDEEKDFARKLFRSAILNADEYQRYMSEASRNWDFSRLAYMDVVIMQIAIAEMLTFPNIPISVTINEFVDLAKLYSTHKSGGYINGMLDAIARHLIDTGKLAKYIDPKPEKPAKAPKAPKVMKAVKVKPSGRKRIIRKKDE